MAKNSKAAKIREYLADHPDAKAADVVAALKSQRVKVSGAQVYNVKAANGKPKRRAKSVKRSKGDTLTALIEAKKLADKLGGVERARDAVNALARLL
ncbi:MAG TPA: hypothetical protein VMP01_06000 [Pirellulaceae bacterium]|nr:hypothetical protein [Pirellulaceae bacterium]